MDMNRRLPFILGAAFGMIHVALVGIPFILSGGGGEAIGYRVLFVDFPLYLLAELVFPRLLLNSVPFNFLWFVVFGTVMYCVVGYAVGSLFNRVGGKKNVES